MAKSPDRRVRTLGGYNVEFRGANDSLESVFGSKAIDTSEMTKKLWAYLKRKKLIKRV